MEENNLAGGSNTEKKPQPITKMHYIINCYLIVWQGK